MSCSDISDLRSENFSLAMAAPRRIFECGSSVLKLLEQEISNGNSFEAACGAQVLETDLIEVDFETGARLDNGTEPLIDPPRNCLVGEVALYLIVAILHGDLYFAESCLVRIEGIQEPTISEVASRLQRVQVLLSSLETCDEGAATLEQIDSLMKDSNISFPERRAGQQE